MESTTRAFTRARNTTAAGITNMSAIMDHVCSENHITHWDSVKVAEQESNETGRLTRKAIWIRNSIDMNQD